jgi:hypothetical protein
VERQRNDRLGRKWHQPFQHRRQILRTIGADPNAYTNCNCDAEPHTHAYTNCNCDAEPHTHAYTNRVTYTSSNTYTKNSSDSEESANTTPASIEALTNEANGPIPKQVQCACHDTLPWLISGSLGIVDHLRRRFARFKLGSHLLQARMGAAPPRNLPGAAQPLVENSWSRLNHDFS